ncbi:MAG: substrate-binding domain-containing protein [Lachnospiraceae bacterium]|nr:substrate-binding domain-containing protein [Lachnospiraceae bacterium]
MKNSRKEFIMTETVLALLIVIVAFMMFREKSLTRSDKVSVILQDSDDSRWSALKYGLRMAAADQGVEVFVVSTEDRLTVSEAEQIAETQLEDGADALILQPVSDDGMEEMIQKLEKKVPVLLLGSLSSEQEEVSPPAVKADDYEMGATLAKELLCDYSENLEGKTIGIVSEAADSQAVIERELGFRDTVSEFGAQVLWSVTGFRAQFDRHFLEQQDKVDFVAALDNSSTIMAGQESAANNLRGALVYGIGCSTEAVYYLDSGRCECLVVPDDFNVGYQSLSEAAGKLKKFFFYEMENRIVSHTVLRRSNLFSEENQEIIFTMNQ